MEQDHKRRKMRLGAQVLGGLVILDAIEYVVGVALRRGALVPLLILAIPQAWLIVRYYMHIQQLRREGEA